jgi:succinate dehydrogenase / fumarate reductase, cytochrome b subunit
MSSFVRLVWSSLGKKYLMAISGAGLCGFLVTHLAGNLLIFVGPKAYNNYAHALETNPLLIPAELALLAVFVVHVGTAVSLAFENRNARPVPYAYERTGLATSKGGRNEFNWTMMFTGIWTLVFIVLHLVTFKFADHRLDAQGYKDFHGLVVQVFSKWWYVVWYIASMGILGFHLRHGFQSMLRSIGAYNTRNVNTVDTLALAFAGLMAGGYMAIPLWVHFIRGVF